MEPSDQPATGPETGPETGDDGASRGRIIAVATRLFREKGYEAATMREIAAASGIRSSSLYHHFPSKEDLLEQVLERGIGTSIRRMREAIAAVPADRPFAERLHAAVIAHLGVVNDLDSFSVGSIHTTRLPAAVMQRYAVRRREFDGLWSSLIAEGVAGGAVAAGSSSGVVRLMIYGALNWSAEWLQPDRGSLGKVADIATAFILDGLAGPEAQR